jgi:hypothetical protein
VAQLDARRQNEWMATQAGPEARARAEDLVCSETAMWLVTPPIAAFQLHIEAGPFRRELAHRIGAEALPEAVGLTGPCPLCNKSVLDPCGHHAMGCGGGITRRHNALNRAGGHLLRTAGVPHHMEQTIREAGELLRVDGERVEEALAHYEEDSARADQLPGAARPNDTLLLSWPTKPGSASGPVGVDYTCVKPDSDAALKEGAARGGTALDAAHERKVVQSKRALADIGVTLLPLVLSTNGRLHPDTAAFMAELARRAATTWATSAAEAMRRVRTQYSVALHRANGEWLANVGARLSHGGRAGAIAKVAALTAPRRRAAAAAAAAPRGPAPVVRGVAGAGRGRGTRGAGARGRVSARRQ